MWPFSLILPRIIESRFGVEIQIWEKLIRMVSLIQSSVNQAQYQPCKTSDTNTYQPSSDLIPSLSHSWPIDFSQLIVDDSCTRRWGKTFCWENGCEKWRYQKHECCSISINDSLTIHVSFQFCLAKTTNKAHTTSDSYSCARIVVEICWGWVSDSTLNSL